MERTEKHTRIEWRVKPSQSNPAFNVVGTRLGEKYKIARCPYTVGEDGQPYDLEEAKANAEFICTAVNAHDKLKEALKEAVLQIEYLHEKYGETGSGNTVVSRSHALLLSLEPSLNTDK